MSLDTYAHLQTAIGNLLNRSDLTSVMPDFITLCEAEMNRRTSTRLRFTSTTITIDAATKAVPTDFAGVQSFSVTSADPDVQLAFVDPAKFQELLQGLSATGSPRYYAIIGSNFWFAPTPDGTYTGTLIYRQKIPDLATNLTNWVLTNHPDAYLYGSAYHAAAYLKDVDLATGFLTLFEKAMGSILEEDQRVQFAGSRLNVRASRCFG